MLKIPDTFAKGSSECSNALRRSYLGRLAIFHAVQAAFSRLCFCSIDSPVAMKSLANPRVISDVFTVVNRLSVGKEQMLRNLADAGLRCHYALSQFFARPEMGDVPGLDGHLVSRGRISS